MRILGRYRRGQIRGIDFSLALIIFLLTMSQVLVLTNTFIQNARDSQGLNASLSLTQTYAQDIITSPGVDNTGNINWQNALSTNLNTNTWKFGLGDGNGSISPYKLGRLANNSESNYLLSYNDIKAATSYGIDFELRFRSPIDISITDTILIGNQLNVTGIVSKASRPLDNSVVNIYVIDNGNQVYEVDLFTNGSGIFTTIITLTSTGSVFVMAMTRYGQGNYDVDYRFATGTTTYTQNSQTLTESTGTGYTLNTNAGSGSYDFYAFYIGSDQNYTTGATASSSSDLSIPQLGMVIILGWDSTGQAYTISTFPLIMDSHLNDGLYPVDPFGTQSTSVELVVNIRGVLLEFSFTTWS